MATNYDVILSTLHAAAGSDTTTAVVTYYNPLPACRLAPLSQLAERVLEGGDGIAAGLNDIIRRTAHHYDVVIVETAPVIGLEDLVGGLDCLHPDDSGHANIAAAFVGAVTAEVVGLPGRGIRVTGQIQPPGCSPSSEVGREGPPGGNRTSATRGDDRRHRSTIVDQPSPRWFPPADGYPQPSRRPSYAQIAVTRARVPEGQFLVRRLVEHTDILVDNFRPGTLERWGLGWDATTPTCRQRPTASSPASSPPPTRHAWPVRA